MAFWKKFYKSKYTGAEIDAAVAQAGTVPAVSSADAGKILGVDAEGKIVVKSDPLPATTGDDEGKTLIINNEGGYGTGFIYKFTEAPAALNTRLNAAILGIATALASDYKYHRASVSVNASDPDYEDIYDFLNDINDNRYLTVVRIANMGDTLTKVVNVEGNNVPSIASYGITAGLGLGEIIIVVPTVSDQGCALDIYARRCEVAT